MLGGKKKYKCKFEIKVEKIEGLPDKIKGNPFRVEYTRGKDHSGISRSVTMTSANMSINYSFKFDCNILYEDKKGSKKFSEKSLVFQVVAEKSKDVKKEANIAKCEFDLATITVPGDFEPKQRLECHGKDKGDVKCVLVVSFKTEVVKIDGKKLVKVDPSKPKTDKKKSSSSKDKLSSSGSTDVDPYADDLPDFGSEDTKSTQTVEVDGQEYDLQTDMDLSEGGMDSDNDAKTENDYLSDSDDKEDPFEQDAAPTEAELKKLKQLEEEEASAAAKEKEKKEKEAKLAAEKAEKSEKEKKAAEDKKASDEKKAKEDEKKSKEDEKKAKEDEKKKKEEEEKRKKDEKKAKEEEDKRKKEEEKKKKAEEEEEAKKKKLGLLGKKDKEVPATSSTSTDKPEKPEKPEKPATLVSEKSTSSTKVSSTSTSSSSSSSSSKAQQQEHDRAVSILEDRIKVLTSEKESALTDLSKTKQELSSEHDSVLSLKKELRALEPQLEDFKAENDRLKDKLSNGGNASSSGDSQEITRLETQVRTLRIEKQELQTELENVQKTLKETESSMAMYDIEYSQKCIGDLENENAKLRKLLDDSDLLTGDLMQELKHRQSERSLRVEKHTKEVETGMASPAEITGYKRHSRQSSTDSNISASSSKSPRTNGTHSDSREDVKKPSSSSTKSSSAKETNKETSKDPTTAKSPTLIVPEPKKAKKSSTLTMDDDNNLPALGRVGSKRVASPLTALPDEYAGDGFGAADSSEHVKNLESRVKHNETIESLLYNAKTLYNEEGEPSASLEMVDYLLGTKSLDRHGQHSESSHSLLVHVLSAIYGQTQRHRSDLDVLIGMFQWATTLLKALISKTEILEDAPANSNMTWASSIDETGIILKYDAVIDFVENMSEGALQVEKTFDDLAADATPGEAFLALLDQIISYLYTLIFACMQQFMDEHRLVELFFGQTSQLAAALNGSNPNARSNLNGKPRPVTVRPMGYFTAQLDVFLGSSRRHHLPKSIESQLLGQLFFWCSATMVNALVSQPERCCAATGMSLKVAISHVEQWISHNTHKKLSVWVEDQFAAAREAANVLTIDKRIFQSIDALEGIFTTLNIAQIHKLLSQFQPDDFAPDPVSKTTLDVLKSSIAKLNAKVTFLDGTILITLVNDE